VRLEVLGQLRNPMTSSGIEFAPFRLVALCLNQLRYRVFPFTTNKSMHVGFRQKVLRQDKKGSNFAKIILIHVMTAA
jgi:hypothetical protein